MLAATSRSPRRWILALVGVLLLLLLTAGSVARLYTDFLWFGEIGQTGVFTGSLGAQLTLALAVGLATALVIWVNLAIVQRFTPRSRLTPVLRPSVEQYRILLGARSRWIGVAVALLLGLLVGLQATAQWERFLLWRNRVPFGEVDPQFNRDIGFYVFELPFLRSVFGWALTVLIIATVVTAVAYYFAGAIRPQAPSGKVAPTVIAHLSVLLGLIVLLKAWAYRLDQFDLLYSPRGTVSGASYTDVNAQLPALQLLVIAAIVVSALFFYNVRQRGYVLPVAGIVVLGLVSVLIGGVYPSLIQRFQVAPQELQREEPFIQRNIAATRSAYDLDRIELSDFPAEPTLTPEQLEGNRSTIENIRVWEPEVLKQATSNLQAVGQYYDFRDVDVDRYVLDGEQRQVMISAREVDPTRLQQSAQTWQNLHLAYTHGYGVVATQVNTATEPAGRPEFVVRDFDLEEAPIPVQQPRIYFGELMPGAPSYVVANTRQAEVGAPSPGSEEGTADFNYDGEGGVQVSNIARRAAFAMRFQDVNLLISDNITTDSRLMFDRRVQDRIEKTAPFLEWDGDPYVAVVDGRIVFIRDGYTVSNQYPYSEPVDLAQAARRTDPDQSGVAGQANYIRNSVKAVVDAYDGSVTMYVNDEDDPILKAWSKAFPDLFTSADGVDDELRNNFRYPEDLFAVQAERFKSYHITNARNFYSKQDFWDLPEDRSGPVRSQDDAASLVSGTGAAQRVRPYYLFAKLPGQESEEFVLVQAFTPNNRANMVSYLAAKTTGDGSTELASYSLPRARQISGPAQVNAQILADPTIAQEVTLFNQQGAQVTIGNLLVVPIEDSLLYVQPLFVQARGNAIPELRRVAVFYNDRIGYKSTLGEAITEVLAANDGQSSGGDEGGGGDQPPPAAGTPPVNDQEAIEQANAALEEAQQALENGNLGEYQRKVEEAQELLGRGLGQDENTNPDA